VLLNGSNYSLTIEYVEDWSEVHYADSAVEYLIENKSVDFVFGPYSSLMANSVSHVAQAHNKLLLSGYSLGVPESTTLSFSLLPHDVGSINAGFGAMATFGAASVGVLKETGTSRCQLADVESLALTHQLSLVDWYELNPDSPTIIEDLTSIMQEFQNKSVDVVMGCAYSSLCVWVRPVDISDMTCVYVLAINSIA
jgi:hypothetical protein